MPYSKVFYKDAQLGILAHWKYSDIVRAWQYEIQSSSHPVVGQVNDCCFENRDNKFPAK